MGFESKHMAPAGARQVLTGEGGDPGRDGRHDCAPGGLGDPGDKVSRQGVEVGKAAHALVAVHT